MELPLDMVSISASSCQTIKMTPNRSRNNVLKGSSGVKKTTSLKGSKQLTVYDKGRTNIFDINSCVP